MERYRQNRGARRTRELNDALDEVTCLTNVLTLKEAETESLKKDIESLRKERDDGAARIVEIEEDIESVKVKFTERAKTVTERNKRACFKNFIEGMIHERDMVNLRSSEYESVVVPINPPMWEQWKAHGIPVEHPPWPKTLQDLTGDEDK